MTTGERLLAISTLLSGTTMQLFMNISGGTSVPHPELTAVDITNCTYVGNDGQIIITATGGTLPYLYSIGDAYLTSNIFTGLTDNTYTISVKDYKHMVDSIGGIRVSVPSIMPPMIRSVITIDCSVNNTNDGSIEVIASGGTQPYMYSLNDNPYQYNKLFTGLPASTYKISVKDNNGIINTLSGIRVGATVINTTSGGGYGRGIDRHKPKVNVKNIRITETNLNEGIRGIKVNVIV